jgi:hypothetical protein
MSLNTSDEGYNNGKKYGQKGTICGPNSRGAIMNGCRYHTGMESTMLGRVSVEAT